MSWFRSRSRLGALVALFALAIQLALTFGHVHFAAASAPTQVGDVRGKIATATPDPAPGDTPALADDYCAVCALIQLAGSLVTPAAPPLPPPIDRGVSQHSFASDFNLSRAPPTRFLARAPPSLA